MADNVTIKDAAGATQTVAADSVSDALFGAAQVQFLKLLDARDGSAFRVIVLSGGALVVDQAESEKIEQWQAAVIEELRGIRDLLGHLTGEPVLR